MAVASPVPPNPSDALASIAAAMAAFSPSSIETFAEAVDRIDVGLDPPEEWVLDASALCLDVLSELGGIWPPPVPDSAGKFAEYARQLQRLDRWHKPTLPTAIDLGKNTEHEEALDRLIASEQFNANADAGTLIPRES